MLGKARRHKENLVRSAMRLFRRQGYAATGLQQILELSGAPKGSLYHYFPGGKEAVGEAAVELASELVARTLEDLAAASADPEAFVSAYFGQYAEWMEASEFQSGCPIATTLLETAPRSASITAAGLAAFDRWVQVIAGVFERSGVDAAAAREQARFTIAALEGALLLARVHRSKAVILGVGRSVAASLRAA